MLPSLRGLSLRPPEGRGVGTGTPFETDDEDDDPLGFNTPTPTFELPVSPGYEILPNVHLERIETSADEYGAMREMFHNTRPTPEASNMQEIIGTGPDNKLLYNRLKVVGLFDINYGAGHKVLKQYTEARKNMVVSSECSEEYGTYLECTRTDQLHGMRDASGLGPLLSSINEKYLIHGTPAKNVESLLKGIDPEASTSSMYSPSIAPKKYNVFYQAEEPGKNDQYADSVGYRGFNAKLGIDTSYESIPRTYYLIITRTILGCANHINRHSHATGPLKPDLLDLQGRQSYDYNQRFRKPFTSLIVEHGKRLRGDYDSGNVGGKKSGFREFLVQDGKLVLPVMLVAYVREKARPKPVWNPKDHDCPKNRYGNFDDLVDVMNQIEIGDIEPDPPGHARLLKEVRAILPDFLAYLERVDDDEKVDAGITDSIGWADLMPIAGKLLVTKGDPLDVKAKVVRALLFWAEQMDQPANARMGDRLVATEGAVLALLKLVIEEGYATELVDVLLPMFDETNATINFATALQKEGAVSVLVQVITKYWPEETTLVPRSLKWKRHAASALGKLAAYNKLYDKMSLPPFEDVVQALVGLMKSADPGKLFTVSLYVGNENPDIYSNSTREATMALASIHRSLTTSTQKVAFTKAFTSADGIAVALGALHALVNAKPIGTSFTILKPGQTPPAPPWTDAQRDLQYYESADILTLLSTVARVGTVYGEMVVSAFVKDRDMARTLKAMKELKPPPIEDLMDIVENATIAVAKFMHEGTDDEKRVAMAMLQIVHISNLSMAAAPIAASLVQLALSDNETLKLEAVRILDHNMAAWFNVLDAAIRDPEPVLYTNNDILDPVDALHVMVLLVRDAVQWRPPGDVSRASADGILLSMIKYNEDHEEYHDILEKWPLHTSPVFAQLTTELEACVEVWEVEGDYSAAHAELKRLETEMAMNAFNDEVVAEFALKAKVKVARRKVEALLLIRTNRRKEAKLQAGITDALFAGKEARGDDAASSSGSDASTADSARSKRASVPTARARFKEALTPAWEAEKAMAKDLGVEFPSLEAYVTPLWKGLSKEAKQPYVDAYRKEKAELRNKAIKEAMEEEELQEAIKASRDQHAAYLKSFKLSRLQEDEKEPYEIEAEKLMAEADAARAAAKKKQAAEIRELAEQLTSAMSIWPEDEETIDTVLAKLEGVVMTLDLLRETGVEKTVNAIKKLPYAGPAIVQHAADLVNLWKTLQIKNEAAQAAAVPAPMVFHGGAAPSASNAVRSYKAPTSLLGKSKKGH